VEKEKKTIYFKFIWVNYTFLLVFYGKKQENVFFANDFNSHIV